MNLFNPYPARDKGGFISGFSPESSAIFLRLAGLLALRCAEILPIDEATTLLNSGNISSMCECDSNDNICTIHSLRLQLRG